MGNLTLDDEDEVNKAEELVLKAQQLGALPASINGYDKLQSLKAKLSVRALHFDGADDYVSVANAADLSPDSITIEAWIKPENFDTPAAGIVSKYLYNGVPSYSLRLSEVSGMTNHIEFTVNDNYWGSNVKRNTLVSTDAILKNEWTHIAAVFNANGGIMQLYINGALSGEQTGAILAKNDSPINMGRDFSSRYFEGSIDDVRIWGKALSVEQIATKQLTGTEEGLIANWNFNQSGDVMTDLTGKHNGQVNSAKPVLN